MNKIRKKYIYNYFSALSFKINKKIYIYKSFTCIDFVVYVLQKYTTPLEEDCDFISIKELENKLKNNILFEDNFDNYNLNYKCEDDEYEKKHTLTFYTLNIIKNFLCLILRRIVNKNDNK